MNERIVSQEQLDKSITEIADAQPQAVSAGALGTYSCPICGKDSPHEHSGQEIHDWRFAFKTQWQARYQQKTLDVELRRELRELLQPTLESNGWRPEDLIEKAASAWGAMIARECVAHDQKVRETTLDGWIHIRTSFYKELLAIATKKATNDSTK